MPATVGSNSVVVKQQNMEAVKRILYRKAPISRADIAVQLGLTPATITNITADLISRGYVEEMKEEPGKPAKGAGRKPVMIDLKRDCHTVLGLSLGRDSTCFAICDMRGEVLASGIYEVMNDEYSVMLHQLQGILSLIRQEHGVLWEKLLGIGIAIPGIVNAHQGIVKNHGKERLSWRNQPLGEEISRFTGLPVRVENNVKARSNAITLFWPNLLEGGTTFALCYVSFGIACPFVMGDRVFRGEDAAAGEIGKMILRPELKEAPGFAPPGSLEALSSARAIIRQCQEQMKQGRNTVLNSLCPNPAELRISHVLEAQRQGDETVREIMEQAMFYVGIALANIVDIINPRLIILSGPLFANHENVETVEHTVRQYVFLPEDEILRIQAVDMSEYAGAIGAVAGCIDKYFIRA